MLSNAYFLAKFRFDTAENEPAKNLQNFRKMHFQKMHFRKMRVQLSVGARGRRGPPCARAAPVRTCRGPPTPAIFFRKILQIFGGLVLGCIKTNFCKKICVRQHFSSSTFLHRCNLKIFAKNGLKKQQFS